jgi:hypothetical protein
MTGGEEGAPQGPNMAALTSMMQSGGDPTQRLYAAFPPLGFNVDLGGSKVGLGGVKTPLLNLFASSQNGKYGLFGSNMFESLNQCFVPMDTIANWNTQGLESVMAHIDGMPVEGGHIEGAAIEGQAIEGQSITAAAASAGLEDVNPSEGVSQPNRAIQHQAAIERSTGASIDV